MGATGTDRRGTTCYAVEVPAYPFGPAKLEIRSGVTSMAENRRMNYSMSICEAFQAVPNANDLGSFLV